MRRVAKEASSPTRRGLLRAGTVAALTAASYRRVLGANERVGLGFVGFGLIGKRHVLDFQAQPDAGLVAVAEVHEGRRDEAAATMGGSPRKVGDFRKLLDDKGVDAVVVSTPDHWHALMTMMACAAGKDVYVEKPTSLFVREGRWMVDVARKHGRVVQVGTQQRSGPHYQRARDLIRDGRIGRVVAVRMWSHRNIMPGFGSPPDGDPAVPGLRLRPLARPGAEASLQPQPRALPFPLVLGLLRRPDDQPRPAFDGHRPLEPGRRRRQSCLKLRRPVRPPRQRRDARHPGHAVRVRRLDGLVVASRGVEAGHPRPMVFEFCGTLASLTVNRRGFTVTPDPAIDPDSVGPRFGSAQPVGGPVRTSDPAKAAARTEPLEDRSGDEYDQFRSRTRRFPRRHQVATGAGVGPGERSPGRDGLPPGEPLPEARPQAQVGREARGRRRRRRG